MKIGYVGLGKMGHNMVLRLIEKGHTPVVFDENEKAVDEVVQQGAQGVSSLPKLVGALEESRVVWLMVPHDVVDSVLEKLVPLLSREDIIIDGGNSFYKESVRRGEELSQKGIRFLDVGVSGGPFGARNGACLMVGGEPVLYNKLESLFRDLAVPEGYGHFGRVGAGHFAKMVHNGIEYGMMQALAEGFALMRQSNFDLDLPKVARVYNHGSVITSRLVGWLVEGYQMYGADLDGISSTVGHTGEGAWTVDTAHELKVPVPVIEASLGFRKESNVNPSYTGQVLSTLRYMFGGHVAQK